MASLTRISTYGKIRESDQEKLEARRKTRKRITIITLSSLILAGVVVAAVLGSRGNSSNNGGGSGGADKSGISASVKAVCDVTLYPTSCYKSLGPAAGSAQLRPEELFKLSIQVALDELSQAARRFSSEPPLLQPRGGGGNMTAAALVACRDLLGLAIDHLNSSLSSMAGGIGPGGPLAALDAISDDLKTWLSAAGAYQETCIDGIEEATPTGSASVRRYLKEATELTSNSLAIVTEISDLASSVKLRRRLLSQDQTEAPAWFNRKLMESSNNWKSKLKVDAVVAKDASGKYNTIGHALRAAPEKSKERFVIYVKKGVYIENVRVEKSKWNVMMFGDGMNATIVSGSLNFVDGTPTFASATFAVLGKGFIARDMGFKNTAGPSKHQAVALMSTSDQSVFYRCRIDAFQDALYAHSNRQFYRECTITGTVDFIFGNSAVVLQNCNILPRLPMPGQQNTVTAQGKVDPNQNTGISIHNCSVSPAEDLGSVRTYLGRPWKAYSTTVYSRSMLGRLIEPTGWMPWNGTTAPNTIFYAEYQNFGPGSSTKNRVKWKGLRNLSSKEASKFSVKSFIKGGKWISAANVNFKADL